MTPTWRGTLSRERTGRGRRTSVPRRWADGDARRARPRYGALGPNPHTLPLVRARSGRPGPLRTPSPRIFTPRGGDGSRTYVGVTYDGVGWRDVVDRPTDRDRTPSAPPADPGPAHAPGTDALDSVRENVGDAVAKVAEVVKPRSRGWIHAGTFPVALVASIVLVLVAPPVAGKVACAVFGLSACSSFGTSAVYHRGTWSPRVAGVSRRADHSNIFLIIAGTYTPLAVLSLPQRTATISLAIVWSGASLGLLARISWLDAPRWVYVPIYVALGWVAVGYMPQFWTTTNGPAIVWLVAVGGLAYTSGAVVYGIKKPNPSPRWFGFHEIFHVLTVVGYGCHYAAILIAALAAR
ncbi:hypothetical protein OY671_004969 [Metschnikowia pulcherrima]|nr:hypothetical protein OY671_004969 [Metschnikowia pulcherrima]